MGQWGLGGEHYARLPSSTAMVGIFYCQATWAPPPQLDSLAPLHSPQEIGWKHIAPLCKA